MLGACLGSKFPWWQKVNTWLCDTGHVHTESRWAQRERVVVCRGGGGGGDSVSEDEGEGESEGENGVVCSVWCVSRSVAAETGV